jgi:hypothetical protein
METEYDKQQDRRLDDLERQNKTQSEQIEQNLLQIQELRDYIGKCFSKVYEALLPEQWRAPVQRYIIRPIVLLFSIIIAVFGAWDFGVWYLDRLELSFMVKRYLRVAEEIYEKENNADVALLFIQKAMDLDSDNPEGCFLKAYMQGMAATRHLLNLDRPLT